MVIQSPAWSVPQEISRRPKVNRWDPEAVTLYPLKLATLFENSYGDVIGGEEF